MIGTGSVEQGGVGPGNRDLHTYIHVCCFDRQGQASSRQACRLAGGASALPDHLLSSACGHGAGTAHLTHHYRGGRWACVAKATPSLQNPPHLTAAGGAVLERGVGPRQAGAARWGGLWHDTLRVAISVLCGAARARPGACVSERERVGCETAVYLGVVDDGCGWPGCFFLPDPSPPPGVISVPMPMQASRGPKKKTFQQRRRRDARAVLSCRGRGEAGKGRRRAERGERGVRGWAAEENRALQRA